MRTIEVTDELYEQLTALAQEMATQDNRCTAKPYIFQVQTDKKVWVGNLNGDYKFLIRNDGEELGDWNKDTVTRYCDDHEIPYPDWLGEFDSGMEPDWLLYNEWLEEQKLCLESYSIVHNYENAFLTAKACQQHIKRNGHHYVNPRDYLSHAFRNPELELVFTFLQTLVSNESKGH